MRSHQITLYDTLGVASDASQQEIRSAFRKLTLASHPDRFSGEERDRAEERFQEITEAFNILSRPESRDKYDRELVHGGESKVMDSAEIARRLAAKGAQHFRAGELSEALENLKLAVDHDDNSARAHYFLGAVYSRMPGRERDALRHMENAARLEPHNTTITAEAAQLFLAAGMKARASRYAQQALELDATNAKAAEVLEKLEEDEKPQSEGLLGMLRRKG